MIGSRCFSLSAVPRKRPAGERRPSWTHEERVSLVLAHEKHGTKWAQILQDEDMRPRFHKDRTSKDMNNQWRKKMFEPYKEGAKECGIEGRGEQGAE